MGEGDDFIKASLAVVSIHCNKLTKVEKPFSTIQQQCTSWRGALSL